MLTDTPVTGTQLPTDDDLLRDWVAQRSDTAMTTLVRRYLDFVCSAVRHHLRGDSHAVEDATQAVFIVLAQKADTIRGKPLAGWLYQTSVYCAKNYRRAERRRRIHESAASRSSSEIASADPIRDPHQLLDAALASMSSGDRELILMRYFRNDPMPLMAERLNLSESTLRKRLSRATERMRQYLLRQGSTIPIGNIGLPTVLAPAGLEEVVRHAACGGPVNASVSACASATVRGLGLVGLKTALTIGLAVSMSVVVVGITATQMRSPTSPSVSQVAPAPAVVLSNALPPPTTRRFEDPGELPPPLRTVQVAQSLDNMGRPRLVRLQLARDFRITQLPTDDPTTITPIALPQGEITVERAMNVLRDHGIHPRHISADTSDPTWVNRRMQFSVPAATLTEVLEQICTNGRLWTLAYMDPVPNPTIYFEDSVRTLPTVTLPWARVWMEGTGRVTRVVPPVWTRTDNLNFQFRYWVDPSVRRVVQYPPTFFQNGDPAAVPKYERPYLLGDQATNGTAPASFASNGSIAELRGTFPLKLIYRTRTIEFDLPEGGNVPLSIDGLVVSFSNFKRQADGNGSLLYGFIRQPGQSEEWFTQKLAEYDDIWMRVNFEATGASGGTVKILRGAGRGSGASGGMVWVAETAGPVPAGPLHIRWEVPAVEQLVNLPLFFKDVKVPE